MDPIIRAVTLAAAPRPLRRGSQPLVRLAAAGAAPPSVAPAPLTPPAVAPQDGIAQAEARMAEALALAREEMACELARERELLRGEAEAELAQARAHAEARGFSAGEEQGLAAGRAALQAEIGRVTAVAAQLAQARGAAFEQVEESALEVVLAAVGGLLGASMATREQVALTVGHLLVQARAGAGMTVRLHPADLALLTEGERGAHEFDAEIVLCADRSVALGGCIVDGPQGRLDLRFETRIEQIRTTLLEARAARVLAGDRQ